MKLSTRARYGLHCMIAISRETEVGSVPVSLEKVATRTGLSKKYLEQIAITLRSAHLIRGVSGRGGGYLLARPADRISLRQIVEATIGPINIVDCVCDPEQCISADHCESRLVYLLINQSITEVLDQFRLADLSDSERLATIVESFNDDRASRLKLGPRPGETLSGCRLDHAPHRSAR